MTTPDPVPFSASTAEYYYGWCRRVHSALVRDGQACRLSPAGLAIQAKSLQDNLWRSIQLPNGGIQFYSVDDRLLMYEMVTGLKAIPEPVVEEAV